MNTEKLKFKSDNSGTFFINFHYFNQKKFFSIFHDYYKLSFYFSFEEEKLTPENSDSIINDYSKYIDIYYKLFHKAELLNQQFHKNNPIDCFYYFDDLFKHSIYSKELSDFLFLELISEKLLVSKIKYLSQSKYAFNYFFIYYFCNDYYFSTFISFSNNTETFFDFIYANLDKKYIQKINFLFIENEYPLLQLFMSIDEKSLSFNTIIKNMMKNNYKFSKSHIDFFNRYCYDYFYSYALEYMDKENLQRFTLQYGFVINEEEYTELENFIKYIEIINIPDFILKNNCTYQEIEFLSNLFLTLEKNYTYDYLISHINLFYPLLENFIPKDNDEYIASLKYEVNSEFFNVFLESLLLQQNLKYF